MVWTKEAREKGQAVRRANRQAKLDAAQGVTRALDTVRSNTEIAAAPVLQDIPVKIAPFVGMHFPPQNDFDWKHAPLNDCLAHLGDLKREYDRIAQIVMSRQAILPDKIPCWTQLHKDIVPKSVQAICRKTMENGRWASRDDAVFKVVDGIRIPDPVFCCSSVCHEYYQKSKQAASVVRH